MGVLVGCGAGIAFGFAIGPFGQRSTSNGYATAQRPGRSSRLAADHHPRTPRRAGRRCLAFLLSLEDSVLRSALVGVVVALTFGLAFGFVIWLVSDIWHLPIATAARCHTTFALPHRHPDSTVQTRLRSALLFGLIGGFLAALALGLVTLPRLGNFYDPQSWMSGVVVGGVTVGLLLGLIGGFRTQVATECGAIPGAAASTALDTVKDYGSRVPLLLAGSYFGVLGPDAATLPGWLRAMFRATFRNPARTPTLMLRARRP